MTGRSYLLEALTGNENGVRELAAMAQNVIDDLTPGDPEIRYWQGVRDSSDKLAQAVVDLRRQIARAMT